MTDSDDLFGKKEEFEKFADDYQRHQEELYLLLAEYMEQEDLNEEYAAHLLIDMAVRMRMTAYAIGVMNPSVSGLKIDLDRFRREVESYLSEAKKGANEFIGEVKAARAEAEAEEEPS